MDESLMIALSAIFISVFSVIIGALSLFALNLPDFIRIFNVLKRVKSRVLITMAFNPRLVFFGLMGKIFNKKLIFSLASDIDSNLLKTVNFRGILPSITYYLGLFTAKKLILQTNIQKMQLPASLRKKSQTLLKGSEKFFLESEVAGYNKRKYFIWVGRLSREKKPEMIMELAKANLPIKIIGRMEGSYEKLVQELKTYPNIEYLGVNSASELKSRYRESFALLNTSEFEGFPETFLESWSLGTPVISLYFIFEDLLKGEGGVFARGSIQKMIDAMKKISSEKEFFDHLSDTSIDLIKKKYNFHNEMTIICKIIHDVERK